MCDNLSYSLGRKVLVTQTHSLSQAAFFRQRSKETMQAYEHKQDFL